MKAVWKYPLDLINGWQQIEGPFLYRESALPVHVGQQNGRPTLWMEVDDDLEHEPLLFAVFGTGHPIYDDTVHVGTVQIGAHVWHVYMV